jgi:hypothetical protein
MRLAVPVKVMLLDVMYRTSLCKWMLYCYLML